MTYTIGVDLGGTKINTALVKEDKIIKKIKLRTERKKGKNHVIQKIIYSIDLILEGMSKKDIKGIGIGSPGPVDTKNGLVLKAVNLPGGWINVPLREIIEKKFKIKTHLTNDANAMALAENLYGAGKNYTEIVCFTIGTGLGGAVITNNKLYLGKCNAGELGHMIIIDKGEKCGCGNRGCLEAYVSTKGIKRISRKIFGKVLPPLDIEIMGRNGNLKARKVYAEMGKYLGIGIASLTNILDPEIVILGGGMAHAGNLIIKPARDELKKRSFVNKPPKIVLAKLGKDAGVIGAANLPLVEKE